MFFTLPNHLSLLRILLSPVFFLLFISPDTVNRQLSVAVFFLAALTDWYDGIIARRSNTITSVGKFLDPLADKFLTSAAFIAFAVTGYVAWWMVWVIIIRDILITFLRSIAEARNAHITTSRSAQTKTFVQMAALYYLLLLIVGRETEWVRTRFLNQIDILLQPQIIYALMLMVTLLTVVTGIQYLYDNRKFLGEILGSPQDTAD
ncbi:MAG: CDP-diacylglycerol--glycerol-3-phosphate 3-phosphatidyltransferase [Bacteroidota bacterium]|nr:CDP-diacylglycerol--glycerol-3-phosphate 3-phosphatidyltransferase [Bacteroidota bacterium]